MAKGTLEHDFFSRHLLGVLSTVSFGLYLSEEQMGNTLIELLFSQFKFQRASTMMEKYVFVFLQCALIQWVLAYGPTSQAH